MFEWFHFLSLFLFRALYGAYQILFNVLVGFIGNSFGTFGMRCKQD